MDKIDTKWDEDLCLLGHVGRELSQSMTLVVKWPKIICVARLIWFDVRSMKQFYIAKHWHNWYSP